MDMEDQINHIAGKSRQLQMVLNRSALPALPHQAMAVGHLAAEKCILQVISNDGSRQERSSSLLSRSLACYSSCAALAQHRRGTSIMAVLLTREYSLHLCCCMVVAFPFSAMLLYERSAPVLTCTADQTCTRVTQAPRFNRAVKGGAENGQDVARTCTLGTLMFFSGGKPDPRGAHPHCSSASVVAYLKVHETAEQCIMADRLVG